MKRIALAAFLVSLASPTFAIDETSKCALPSGVKGTVWLADFPTSLRKNMPGLGDSNAPFRTDATPGYSNLPSAHLIHAFWRNERWIVLYSTGGFVNPHFVMALDVPKNGKNPVEISNQSTDLNEECRAIAAGFTEKARAR